MMFPSPTIIFKHDNYEAPAFRLKILQEFASIYVAFKMDHRFYSSIE